LKEKIMRWQFWQNPGPQELSENIRKVLASQFHLDSQAMDKARLLKKSGQFASRPVQFILIFDPSLIDDRAAALLKYDQLEKGEHRKALLFEGHIEKTGQILLSDRRPKKEAVDPV
jgi:hypothetical protein